MKFRKSKSIIILLLFISSHAHASGGSAFMFSLFMFVFFALVSFVFFKMVKHYTKKMKNKILGRIFRTLSLSLFMSPSIYIEDGEFMFLPSAVVLQIGGARLIALGSILITSVFVYFYLKKKEKSEEV